MCAAMAGLAECGDSQCATTGHGAMVCGIRLRALASEPYPSSLRNFWEAEAAEIPFDKTSSMKVRDVSNKSLTRFYTPNMNELSLG